MQQQQKDAGLRTWALKFGEVWSRKQVVTATPELYGAEVMTEPRESGRSHHVQ